MNKLNKKILYFLKSIFINRIFRIVIVLIPPIILATPYPLYLDIAQIEVSDMNSEGIKIPTETFSLGKPLFSRILGIEVFDLPVFLCLKNENKISLDGKVISPNELLGSQDAGAMSIPFNYSENSKDNIYAKIGEDNCKELKANLSENVKISFDAEIKNPSPLKSVNIESASDALSIEIELYNEAKVDYAKTKLYGTGISKYIFLNILIFFLGWSFLILHIENLYKFLKGKILDKILLYAIFALEILFTFIILRFLVKWAPNLWTEYLSQLFF